MDVSLMPEMSESSRKFVVAVRPATALSARPRLFEALAQAFPVSFHDGSPVQPPTDATIAFVGEQGALPLTGDGDGGPTFEVQGDPSRAEDREAVRLGDTEAVDRRVRGISLHDRLVGTPLPEGDEVLALAASGPAWTVTRDATPVHRVRSVLPELAHDEVLYALLSRRPIASVALVHFLRELCRPAGWRPPPLRATFLFDDPNLRWRSYGFIDFRRLLEHAGRHGYHAAMATIPIDAGRPYRPAAELFARNPDRLSLVFHGNDHVKRELLNTREHASALALAAQAVRRVARFERRAGVHVDRIMTPPHGLCSEQVARALGAVGFDALFAIHPLPWTEQPPTDPLLAGWRPAEFVAGCAVIARVPLSSARADIAMRAFLDHPLVIYGHHEDVAGGLEPLAEMASLVNGLGPVEWTSVGTIARGNYVAHLDGDRLSVRPYSRRILVPEEARELVVVAPQDVIAGDVHDGWTDAAGAQHRFGEPVELGSGHTVRLHAAGDVDPERVAPPAWRPWPKLRRSVTELRDRALPLRAARGR